MILKLDMSKAYDRVEWLCLENIMEKLGFNLRWRGHMMQCISFVLYSVRINRKPCGNISPSRVLRQRNPLSPYLFLICVEGLSALIKKFIENGASKGLFVCRRGGPSISHLYFADNSLIFCTVSLEECDSLQHVLKVFEVALGQQLNKAKIFLFFSGNIDGNIQEEIKTRFGAHIIRQHEKYLGLPLLDGIKGILLM